MSTIRGVFDIQKPEDVTMRLTLIMPLKDWLLVAEAVKPKEGEPDDYWNPAAQMARMITEMVRKAETTFYDQADKSAP